MMDSSPPLTPTPSWCGPSMLAALSAKALMKHMVGEEDSDGLLTGADIAYIYPDFATVFLGQFSDGVMEKAQEACIVGMEENDTGIKIPSFSSPNGHMHVRQIRTFNHICSGLSQPITYQL